MQAVPCHLRLQRQHERRMLVLKLAQSRVHSRHVSQLSVPVVSSLRPVGGRVADAPEVRRDGKGKREIDPNDDTVGEWTGSEDLRTPSYASCSLSATTRLDSDSPPTPNFPRTTEPLPTYFPTFSTPPRKLRGLDINASSKPSSKTLSGHIRVRD